MDNNLLINGFNLNFCLFLTEFSINIFHATEIKGNENGREDRFRFMQEFSVFHLYYLDALKKQSEFLGISLEHIQQACGHNEKAAREEKELMLKDLQDFLKFLKELKTATISF